MILQSQTSRYNNLYSTTAVYAVGQPLLLGITLEAENNTQPTYVTITNVTDGVIISNLEMCRIGDTDVIDLCSFLMSMYKMDEDIFDTSTQDSLKKFTITITNSGEGTQHPQISIVIFGYKMSKNNGENPTIIDTTLSDPATGHPSGVYKGDISINDMSPLYIPQGYSPNVYFNMYGVQTPQTIVTIANESTILPTQNSIQISKVNQGGTTVNMFTRQIRRKKVCEDSIIVLYLNKYGYFEYFMFDKHYTSTHNYSRGERVSSTLYNNSYGLIGNIYSTEVEQTITASTLINDEDYMAKYMDLSSSRKVFLFKGGDITSRNSWIEVDIETSPEFISKYPNTKVTANFKIKNTKLC